jgi:chemotaxis signal transduction protein
VLPDDRGRDSTLLAITTATTTWSVPSAFVAGVGRLSEWTGAPPLDVSALLGAPASANESHEARVVVLEAQGQTLPLLAAGSLSLLHTTPEQLLELPQALRRASPLIAQVALLHGVPRLFVLDPQQLLQAWQQPQSATADDVHHSSSR